MCVWRVAGWALVAVRSRGGLVVRAHHQVGLLVRVLVILVLVLLLLLVLSRGGRGGRGMGTRRGSR